MDKDIRININNQGLDSPNNLKIRIPTPKSDNIELDEKSKIKKYTTFYYIMCCMYCYPDDDN
jgi:uncharacterized membrane protein